MAELKIDEDVLLGESPFNVIVEKIVVQRAKAMDDAILGEINEIINENGHLTVVNLNEKAIVKVFEKQIPKKPVSYDKHYFKCPDCGKDLGKDEDAIYVYQEAPPNFCEHCGQKIDWSDTE